MQYTDSNIGQHIAQLIEVVRPVQEGELFESDIILAELQAINAKAEKLWYALEYATHEVVSWAEYSSDYMKEKHDLSGTLDKLWLVLKEK